MVRSDLGRLDDRCVDCPASTSLPRFNRSGHLSRTWPGGCGNTTTVQSCAQKGLRATAKAAGLPQKVSGRYLSTEELRKNLLEHVLASTQVGVGCVVPLLRDVTKFVTLCVTLCGAS